MSTLDAHFLYFQGIFSHHWLLSTKTKSNYLTSPKVRLLHQSIHKLRKCNRPLPEKIIMKREFREAPQSFSASTGYLNAASKISSWSFDGLALESSELKTEAFLFAFFSWLGFTSSLRCFLDLELEDLFGSFPVRGGRCSLFLTMRCFSRCDVFQFLTMSFLGDV